MKVSMILMTVRLGCRTEVFGSHVGAKVSVIYHMFIETCKMCGVSTLIYFKEFFKAIMQGRTDYKRSSFARLLPTGRKNMLLMTIENNKV